MRTLPNGHRATFSATRRVGFLPVVPVAVPAKTADSERRVALMPEVVGKLTGAGLEVVVQAGAGTSASVSDQEYTDAGARVVPDASTALSGADVVVKVAPPTASELASLPSGSTYIG